MIAQFECVNNFHHGDSWSTVNPLLSPLGSLFIPSPFFEGGGGAYLRWELFNLEKAMVSVPHKALGYKVAKLKYKKVGGHAAEDQNQIWTSDPVGK